VTAAAPQPARRSPFFILGSGRCGSTYLYDLLAGHPRIALTNEGKVLDFLWFCSEYAGLPSQHERTFALHVETPLRGLIQPDYLDTFAAVFLRHVRAIAEDFYATQFAGKDYWRWGDKLPDPRAALAAQALWPDVAYVVLVRDPRDVLCSFRRFADSGAKAVQERLPGWGKRAAAEFCVEFRSLYGYGLPLVPNALLVRYEDLVEAPQRELDRVLIHLGLDPTAATLDDAARPALFARHGTSSSAAASVGRWRSDLPADEAAYVTQELGDLLARFGYAR
jgi:hypothetical protein